MLVEIGFFSIFAAKNLKKARILQQISVKNSFFAFHQNAGRLFYSQKNELFPLKNKFLLKIVSKICYNTENVYVRGLTVGAFSIPCKFYTIQFITSILKYLTYYKISFIKQKYHQSKMLLLKQYPFAEEWHGCHSANSLSDM